MAAITMQSREAILWAFRLFIGREPRDEAELEFHRQHGSVTSLRKAFSQTAEFQQFLRATQSVDKKAYHSPLALLRPPVDRRIPWRFTPPSLAHPVSQLCTSEQLLELPYRQWAEALGLVPNPHRKVWEFCYVMAAVAGHDLLRPGMRALGFGVGKEPVPSLLARHGVTVLATDAPFATIEGQGWDTTGQHAAEAMALHRPRIVDAATFAAKVSFRPVDMNAIPEDLTGFDFCWSSCAFEHLGSIDRGLAFFENSLRTLKPGGIAVHTTEFNLSSDDDTINRPQLCLFRKRDIEALLSRLIDAGHVVAPLNLYPGAGEIDQHIDLPPYALPHLKLEVGRFVTTSIGIVVRKAPAP